MKKRLVIFVLAIFMVIGMGIQVVSAFESVSVINGGQSVEAVVNFGYITDYDGKIRIKDFAGFIIQVYSVPISEEEGEAPVATFAGESGKLDYKFSYKNPNPGKYDSFRERLYFLAAKANGDEYYPVPQTRNNPYLVAQHDDNEQVNRKRRIDWSMLGEEFYITKEGTIKTVPDGAPWNVSGPVDN
ncbi:hypothetical protein COV49_00260 [Candidatus Falkowbacteria bacterium CG11_big_fil_rev_8_21_14_0_20_39_10]|uniref:Uncharacterized protein n=1 Tax=Candidatus Falkowbacteria bacterium CG11_big_fil_rev_8_21_14_0_20_39_10 TaxID=1974570 RepID=A0A2M6KAH7_9BACT|nr:MAG: hypothetical protein COV49_00260 [Candidatus Falkowbacteria bacterium CG11_big_fil_rev_8_21_14_0_20_39_10]